MASSSLLKAATADLLERTRSRRELAMSVLRGSVAIATLTAGFTFSTLLGQTFTPQHVFRAEQVELLLALTFLFSCMSVPVRRVCHHLRQSATKCDLSTIVSSQVRQEVPGRPN